MSDVQPYLTERVESGVAVPVLVWRLAGPRRAISSGPLGGGIGPRHWVINATVPMNYFRDDPDAHLEEIGAGLGLTGTGVGLMTGVDVSERVLAEDAGVLATATVGLGAPAWAAAPDGHLRRERPGTVNIVVDVPVRLSDAALVNAVATVAEAKAQALWEIGIKATGTASDATVILCAPEGPAEPYGGPRSTWGARIARAVHAAVRDGGRAWLSTGTAWSDLH
jgi:adenosylcobinamide amidohydrolase